jgi:arabinose-5-phosphate isomerase
MTTINHTHFFNSALRVIDIEATAITDLRTRIDADFFSACELMLNCQGRVVVTGMGKSGHIGRKIAATLASTGTPSFFMHAAEANHGDLGMLTEKDVVIAISNSGNTEEIVSLLPVIKRFNIPLISMTGNRQSALGMAATCMLDVSVQQEACPLGLAPTASTTACLVMGDALAITLLEARGFKAEDFALSHPSGTLGKRLILTVDELMHAGAQLPCVHTTASIQDTLLVMTEKGLGMTCVINSDGTLRGLYTDGDLRRSLLKGIDIYRTDINSQMTQPCTTVLSGTLAASALSLMEQRRINGLIVIDHQQRPIGALNMQDLLRAKLV